MKGYSRSLAPGLTHTWHTNFGGLNKDYMQNYTRTQYFLYLPGPWRSMPSSLFHSPLAPHSPVAVSCLFLPKATIAPFLTQCFHPHPFPPCGSAKWDWALHTLPRFLGVQVGWCSLYFSFCLVSASPRFHCIHHTVLPCLSSISVVSTNHSEFQAGKDWDFSD